MMMTLHDCDRLSTLTEGDAQGLNKRAAGGSPCIAPGKGLGYLHSRRIECFVFTGGKVIEYRADFDHEYPVAGTEAYDTIKLTRIDARTAEAILSHAGRAFGTARRLVSDDGQTLTIEFRREGSSVIHNVAVYRKQTQ